MSTVLVQGRRWFQKSCGNTYHSVRVIEDGIEIAIKPFSYGYGNQWMQTGAELLRSLGKQTSVLNYSVIDVQCKKDL